MKCRITQNLGVDASIKVNEALGAHWGCPWGVLGFKTAFRYEYCTFWGVIKAVSLKGIIIYQCIITYLIIIAPKGAYHTHINIKANQAKCKLSVTFMYHLKNHLSLSIDR